MSGSAWWAGRLAAVLGDVEPRLRRLAEQIAADRPDAAGEEWAERLAAVGRELARVAAEAAESARARADSDGLWPPPWSAPPGRVAGPRLGGTGGARPDDGVGMRLAELPPGPAAP